MIKSSILGASVLLSIALLGCGNKSSEKKTQATESISIDDPAEKNDDSAENAQADSNAHPVKYKLTHEQLETIRARLTPEQFELFKDRLNDEKYQKILRHYAEQKEGDAPVPYHIPDFVHRKVAEHEAKQKAAQETAKEQPAH